MVQLGKVYGNLMIDLQVTCNKLRDRGERILRETLGVDELKAAQLLDAADGHVKTALVMGSLDIDRDTAIQRLEEADGRLARILPNLEVH
jgi:N-acetylmuramic acid 6-phosphate etherase